MKETRVKIVSKFWIFGPVCLCCVQSLFVSPSDILILLSKQMRERSVKMISSNHWKSWH